MEQTKNTPQQNSILFALIHVATYVPAVWLLSKGTIAQPLSVIIAIVPIITFAIFVLKYIKSISALDEVQQRVQLEAVVIGFSLTLMLIMLLFLLELCGISNQGLFGYAHMVIYCWAFYFIGWFISRRKYGV